MHRRNFLLAPIALGTLFEFSPAAAQDKGGVESSKQIPIVISKMAAGARPLWRDVGRLVGGNISIEVDLWLRADLETPAPGGVLIRPSFRIIEDSLSGRRPLLRESKLQAKSAPNSNEVHIVGKSAGLDHGDVFRLLGLEFSIAQAATEGPPPHTKVTVSTVAGKESFVIVRSS